MKRKSNAVAAGVGYTIGNVLSKGINFLTLPVFSRILLKEEFGVFNVFMSYDAILAVIIGLGLHMSLRSAKADFEDRIDEYTASISLIYMINLIVLCGLLAMDSLGGRVISRLLNMPELALFLLIMYGFASGIITFFNVYVSLNYDYKSYLKVALFNSLGNVSLSLLLIITVFRFHKDIGRIIGAVSVAFVLSIFILLKLYKKAFPHIRIDYWKYALKISIPIVPHGIAQVLLSQFDRIMISNMVGNAATAVYSLAGNIKLILVIITDSISNAWSTWFFEKMKKKRILEIQKRSIQLCLMFVLFTVILMSVAPEIILIIGGRQYENSKYVAIPMIIDAFILFLYSVIVQAEYYTKKTNYIMAGTMVAAIINIVTNYVFIAEYGYLAAAYTTLFSYSVYLVLHIMISYRLVKFFVLPIQNLLLYISIVICVAGVDLLFIDSIGIRWGGGLGVVGLISIVLLNNLKKDDPSISLKKYLMRK